MKQTALEWYIYEVAINGYTDAEIIKKALQMEKEQIIDAWDTGLCIQDTNDICGEYYYNETFKSE